MRYPLHNNSCMVFIAWYCLLLSCQKDASADKPEQGAANLQVHLKAIVDGQPLIFGKIYKNAFGEDFSVKTFKFYLHGIELINSQTNNTYRVDKSNHFLINTADSSASYIQLSIPSSVYDRITFILGVDSISNVSGAQTGTLDPAKGMFWTWSTGYIMAKLEGNSPVAATPDHVIEYHIGGFKGTENVLRKISLTFPSLQKVDLKPGSQSMININANINTWFNHTHPIRISQNPVSMNPGNLATRIADNYSNMFTVVEIVNE